MTDKGKEKAASEVAELFQNIKLDCGNFEDYGVTPFSILPEEVWDIIFDLLDNSKDIQSCMNSCIEWNILLKSKRTDFLFSQVLPVLEKNQKFSRSEILEIRLVSRKWNQAVLSWLQGHPLHYLIDKELHREGNFQTHEDTYLILDHSWKLKLYELRNNHDCEKLKNRFFTSHCSTKNPLITRHLFISDPEYRRDHQVVPIEVPFYSSVEEILQRYGHHIYHLWLRIEIDKSPEFCNVYEALLSYWLSLVPNLRTLHLDCYPIVIPPNTNILFHEHFVDLKNLQKLEHLEVIIVDCFPSDLLGKLLKRCPNVSKLHCSGNTELTCVRPKLNRIAELCFESPEQLAEKNLSVWPVRKLTLNSGYDFKATFKLLEQFSATLVDLSMNLWDEHGYNERIHLPGLKHLRLKLHGRTCLNFLLPLAQLETLDIDVSRRKNVKRGTTKEIIQFSKMENKMLESNIWQQLPKLCKLRIQAPRRIYFYTRPV